LVLVLSFGFSGSSSILLGHACQNDNRGQGQKFDSWTRRRVVLSGGEGYLSLSSTENHNQGCSRSKYFEACMSAFSEQHSHANLRNYFGFVERSHSMLDPE
jgi:hypothetical protein